MKEKDLLKELMKLPFKKRMFIIEKVIHSIREEEESDGMYQAAEDLFEDYNTDKELTAFTDLDPEDFYETK